MRNAIFLKTGPLGRNQAINIVRKCICYLDSWRFVALGLAMCVALPLGTIAFSFMQPTQGIWQHLVQHQLASLLMNTLILVSGVVTGTLVLGLSLAWLTGACEFPGRKMFAWALLLPLAMPAYVLAFVALGMLDFSGPVQTYLRVWFPSTSLWFPNIRSAGGIIAVMSLSLYPYVYLLAKGAFQTQGKRALEAAQSLGLNRTTAFFRVAVPMARPWITGGLMLVLMETLADFGAVSIFNFDTFTTAIYKAWFGLFSLPAAAQLASLLVLIVFIVIAMEQRARRKIRFTQSGQTSIEHSRIHLEGWPKVAATCFAGTVLLVACIAPFVQLMVWSVEIFHEEFNIRYLGFLGRSLFFAIMASGLVVVFSLLLAYTNRQHKDKLTQFCLKISTLGYALPGTVLAVGIVLAISVTDRWIVQILTRTWGYEGNALLQGTLFSVIVAYLIRFMAVGFNSINSAMLRITTSLDEASIGMGVKGISLLRQVHVPLLKSGLMTAAVLVFVDTMKEMPITLMTRPFGWDTLAIKIFELTSEGEWERAALPAVTLVLGGLIPITILAKQSEK
jgi:iron(III) transport system permease protein